MIRLHAALACASLIAAACAATPRHRFRELSMGTECSVVIATDDEEGARRAARAAFDRIHELDECLSDWREGSELRALPQEAGATMSLSPDLCRALTDALAVAAATDGTFDPTIGPVTRLWREARKTHRAPSAEDLSRARASVGWKLLEVQDCTARCLADGVQLDLGGMGKGFAAAEALSVIRRCGFRAALVAVAGDLALGEAPPGAAGWVVSVDSLQDEPMELVLANCSVSTSGEGEQWALVDGVQRGHLLDASAGAPAGGSAAATVIGPDGGTVDALATALALCGPGEAKEILTRFPGYAARVTRQDSADTVLIAWPGQPH